MFKIQNFVSGRFIVFTALAMMLLTGMTCKKDAPKKSDSDSGSSAKAEFNPQAQATAPACALARKVMSEAWQKCAEANGTEPASVDEVKAKVPEAVGIMCPGGGTYSAKSENGARKIECSIPQHNN